MLPCLETEDAGRRVTDVTTTGGWRSGSGQDQVERYSVLVPTHDDAANIGALLTRLLGDPGVGQVAVVASGCGDDTVAIVAEIAESDPRIQLFVEADRSGKAAAINFGLAQLDLPYKVVVSGDVLPEPGAVSALVAALGQPGVGLAGGRPVPVNPADSPVGHASHLLWRLHDRLARHQPKLGEMIAIRTEALVPLPSTSVDEACFQALIEGAGWQSAYVPAAVVNNRGPATVSDFVRQRRQIHTGHLWLRRRQGYSVPSLRVGLVLSELLNEVIDDPRKRRPRPLAWTLGTVVMEGFARSLARLDYLRGREKVVWAMVKSTKGPTSGPDGPGTS